MTDRHAGYIVTLDKDIREDDAQLIINALKCVRHVVDVKPVIGDAQLAIAEDRVRIRMGNRLLDIVQEFSKR